MLPEFKKRIDTLRQILVGAVPSPAGQIEQITYALVYKFMNDIDDRAASLPGGKRTYFTGNYERFSWNNIMTPTLGAHDRLTLYREALSSLAKNPNLPELFQSIYQNAYLPFNDPRVLTLFLKEIDHFKHSNSDDIGDAYEYLLQITGAQGDVGQFRTPRHIINFMVEVLAPTKDDSILDPACGTAGFLISAFNYVRHQHDGIDEKTGLSSSTEKQLTADDLSKLHKNYHGFDIDPTMVRTARVNMYLHGFKEPDIKNHDSLSSEDFWNERYDVILANPPFMSPKGGIVPHNKFGIKANRAEVLFVDYIASHLKPTGRAGIIVPEGVIFQSGKVYKELRKNLVNNSLYAVIRITAGIFQPYSGVKTSILLLDKELAKKTDKILFIKIQNDGLSLGAQRKEVLNNEIPQAINIIKSFKDGGVITSELSFEVLRSQIAKNNDFNLSGDRYRVTSDYSNAKWPMVELGDVCEIFNGSTPKRTEQEYWKNGTIPWFTIDDIREQGRYISSTKQAITAKGFRESSVKLLPKHSTLLCCTASIGECAYTEIELTTNQQFNGLVVKAEFKEKLNQKFLFWCSTTFKDELERMSGKATFGFVSVGTLKRFKIPLPPVVIQEQIATELDGFAGIIAGAKKIAQNWKPKIDIDPEWDKVGLGELVDLIRGVVYSKPDEVDSNGHKILRAMNITLDGALLLNDVKQISNKLKLKEQQKLKEGDVFICLASGSKDHIGKVTYIENDTDFYFGGFMGSIRTNNKKTISRFVYFCLRDDKFNDYLRDSISGANINNLNSGILNRFRIPLPSLATQKQIVEKIEAEHALVESAKKLIEIYE